MDISPGQIAVWLTIGMLVGSFTGMLVSGSRKGLGALRNLGTGLMGLALGALLFRVLAIDFGLDRIAISLEDLLSAFIGALVFLGCVQVYKTYRNR
jgi:uncharacterized membrane protein YeaQ/YmgE (transglycosylase-associated protein family)